MIHGGRRAATLLFLGDILTFILALWLTLLVRYGTLPGRRVFLDHAGPFGFLFLVWVVVFYMSGLYSKRILLFKSSLPNAIVKTQFLNIALAALFFFLVPGIGIAPKTNLVIYLGTSLLLIFAWRLWLFPRLSLPRSRFPAALIAESLEADELVREVNGNPRYHLALSVIASPQEALRDIPGLAERLRQKRIGLVITDTKDKHIEDLLPKLYELSSATDPLQFVTFEEIYEDVFDRIPLSQLHINWFLENVPQGSPLISTTVKRGIDVLGGIVMGVVTIIASPIIWIASMFEGSGPLFIAQDRLGRSGVHIRTYKFRTMQENDEGKWHGESANRVTRVGAFLRRTSLDEFPQFVNVLTGELSLIGPRNDMAALGARLADALPFYMFRYQVTPGITGWAQINQQYEPGNISPQSIEETKMRLAYDFYYLKHRSLGLDIVIALKTVKRMLFRVSSW